MTAAVSHVLFTGYVQNGLVAFRGRISPSLDEIREEERYRNRDRGREDLHDRICWRHSRRDSEDELVEILGGVKAIIGPRYRWKLTGRKPEGLEVSRWVNDGRCRKDIVSRVDQEELALNDIEAFHLQYRSRTTKATFCMQCVYGPCAWQRREGWRYLNLVLPGDVEDLVDGQCYRHQDFP